MKKPCLLFDAGGTLVFPDFSLIAKVASTTGLALTPGQLFLAHCNLILDLDQRTQGSGDLADPFPNGYTRTLLKPLISQPVTLDTIVTILEDRDQIKSLWASTYPWVSAALNSLKGAGYAMSVISNSDGRVEEILTSLDLRPYFDQVFDSHALGVSKPDPRIFQIALESLNLQAEEALYIGDVYFIDVWGANQARLGCIHLDPQGFYWDWPGVHLTSVAQLPAWLANYNDQPAEFDLHPASNISITFSPN